MKNLVFIIELVSMLAVCHVFAEFGKGQIVNGARKFVDSCRTGEMIRNHFWYYGTVIAAAFFNLMMWEFDNNTHIYEGYIAGSLIALLAQAVDRRIFREPLEP